MTTVKIRGRATGLSAILGPRPWIFSDHGRALRLWRASPRRRRCKALPRFEGDSAPCVNAVDHGDWHRADINFVDVGTAMPPAILDAIVAMAMVRHGRQRGNSDALILAQRQ